MAIAKECSQTVLAFDFGEKRIGVATGQDVSRTAEPVTIIRVDNGRIDWEGISRIITEWQPDQLVVGMPTNHQGEEFGLAPRVQRFCRQLHGRYLLPVTHINENLSTIEARQRIKLQGKNTTQVGLDAVAAQAILETWFKENAE